MPLFMLDVWTSAFSSRNEHAGSESKSQVPGLSSLAHLYGGLPPGKHHLINHLVNSSPTNYKADKHNEDLIMQRPATSAKIIRQQIYRSVASSTAIETGKAVQKIEQNLKQHQAKAKASV
ncbi:hypothetical protein ACSSTN_02070 [Pantoea agglomerans]|jgi:hypothetical protein|uniref:hypothetical protein n=1 Tax=Enterobacter agglomerans TaxID=549 RepID=UPI003ED9E158